MSLTSQRRQRSQQREVELLGEKWPTNLAESSDFHAFFRDVLHAPNLRHGTDGFTSPPKEGVLRIFSPWKIRRLRPGSNTRTWVPKGQHATSRPPKPLFHYVYFILVFRQYPLLACRFSSTLIFKNFYPELLRVIMSRGILAPCDMSYTWWIWRIHTEFW